MNRFYYPILIALNLIVLSLLFYQSKARRQAETESLNLMSRINELEPYVLAVKNEEKLIGKKMPALSSLGGNQEKIRNILTDDRMLLVLFSSSSCQSCVDALMPFWASLAKLKINTFAVANGTSISEVMIYGRLNGVTVPILYDENARIVSELGLPPNTVATLLINKGRVAMAYVSNPNNAILFRERIFLEKFKILID